MWAAPSLGEPDLIKIPQRRKPAEGQHPSLCSLILSVVGKLPPPQLGVSPTESRVEAEVCGHLQTGLDQGCSLVEVQERDMEAGREDSSGCVC